MQTEPKNRFSLTRAGLNARGRGKSVFLSVTYLRRSKAMHSVLLCRLMLVSLFLQATLCLGSTTNNIAAGETLTNSITADVRTNFYIFTGSSNETIRVLAARTAGSGAIGLRLVDPDGVSSGADARLDDAVALFSALKLTKTGNYQLVVWDLFGSLTFDYGLTLIKNPGPNQIDGDGSGGTIVPGETKVGAVASPADIDAYAFAASSNDVVKVLAVRTGGSLSTVVGLQLMAPDGAIVGVDERLEDAVAYFNGLKLNQTGTYQLLVWDSYSGAQVFDYNVTLVINPGANETDGDGSGGAILPGETKAGAISQPADIDAYSFTANANDSVKVLAVRTLGPTFSTVGIQLFAPDGTALGVDERPEDAVAYINSLKLPKTGTYQLFIWSIPPPGTLYPTQTLNYAVSMVKNPGPNATDPDGGIIVSEQTKAGTILTGDLDAFEFLGLKCQDIQVALTNHTGSVAAPVIELQSPAGDILARNSGTLTANLSFHGIPDFGTYLVVVRDSNGTNVFDYDLAVRLTPLPPTNSAAGPELVISVCTNAAVLTWLTNANNYYLEATTNLNAPEWSPVGAPSGTFGTQLYFLEPPVLPKKFYRLHLQ